MKSFNKQLWRNQLYNFILLTLETRYLHDKISNRFWDEKMTLNLPDKMSLMKKTLFLVGYGSFSWLNAE